MQSSKLTKDAPAHPKNAPQPATDVPHEDVSKKQSEAQKKYPVPTQVKQGDTVTLTQGGVDRDNTMRHIAKEGTQPKKDDAGDQDGLTGGLAAVEVPAGGLGAR
ncbi:g6489 [Coccomyxa viridis]|uniref:G6489 protein n=1 Tax=Coccomyxa viridis TaxID=1274662 RepID=A0ABP1FY21_9CHLO